MNSEFIKACLVQRILNTNESIDEIEQAFIAAFPSEDAEVLAECWVEVMSELPELN